MATISGLAICSGGDHVTGTITLAGGQSRQFQVLMSELRTATEETNVRAFVIRQVASLRQSFPNDTPTQFRNRIQATTFME